MAIRSELFTLLLAIFCITNCACHPKEIISPKAQEEDLTFDWDTCGVSKGCFRSPAGCEQDNCAAMISWQDRGDNVHFELSTMLGSSSSDSHWIALGFSESTGMGDTSVISCIHTSDGGFSIESSFNQPFWNEPMDNTLLGIIEGSYKGQVNEGRSMCEFTRAKAVSPEEPQASQFYNLSSPLQYYYKMAHGTALEDGGKSPHMERPITSTTTIDAGVYENIGAPGFEWDTCGVNKGCFRSPAGCELQNCDVIVSWEDRGDNVHFQLSTSLGFSTSDSHWIALGFSEGIGMGDTSVISCIHTSDGGFSIESSFNQPSWNEPMDNTLLGIIEGSYKGQVNEGRSMCEFTRAKAVSPEEPQASQFYNLSSPLQYYYKMAHGTALEDGGKSPHMERPITSTTTIDAGVYENIGAPGFEWDTCGINKGCFRSPAGCELQNCDVIVSWEDRGDNVHFQLSTSVGTSANEAHWIALGLSNNTRMGDTSVVSCIYSADGSSRVESSFNAGYSNTPLQNDSLGVVPGSHKGRSIDGRSECEFTRVKVVSPEEPEASLVYNLTSPLEYHYILAHGGMHESGVMVKHTQTPIVTSTKIDAGEYENIGVPLFDWSSCGVSKGCFRSPAGCRSHSCDVLVSWEDRDEDVHYELSSFIGSTLNQGHWVSLGFSDGNGMRETSIVSCIDTEGGNFTLESSYNPGYFNEPLEDDSLGIAPGSYRGQIADGRLECEFTRVKAVSQEEPESSRVFNLTSPLQYNYIMAYGGLSEDGSKAKHTVAPTVSTTKIDAGVYENLGEFETTTFQPVTIPDFSFDWEDCGQTKGCFRSPAECDPEDCSVLVSWQDRMNQVHFELSILLGSSPTENNWIALGISDTQNMFEASVISCLSPSNGNFQPEVSFNNDGYGNSKLDDSTLGIIEGSYLGRVRGGRSECQFSRVKALPAGTPEGNMVFNLTDDLQYYFLLAHGALNPSGTIAKHEDAPTITPSKIDIRVNEDIGGAFIQPLIKAHATLMLAAWTIFSGIGILNARYFKKAWPSVQVCGLQLWFVIHRVCMSLVLALTLSGFIIIFFHVNGFMNINALDPVLRCHPILGIIVMACVFINPLMAMCRPGPHAPKRPIFNWGHRIVGEGGRICAVFNLMTGLSLPGVQNMVDKWMFWAMIGAICFHLVIEITLLGLHFTKRQNTITPTAVSSTGLDSKKMDIMEEEDKSVKNKPSYTVETILLIVYAVCVASLTLAILIRMAIA